MANLPKLWLKNWPGTEIVLISVCPTLEGALGAKGDFLLCIVVSVLTFVVVLHGLLLSAIAM